MPKLVITYDEETDTVVITTSLKFFTKLFDAIDRLSFIGRKKHVKLRDKINDACEDAGLFM